jgi:hypothetical protein
MEHETEPDEAGQPPASPDVAGPTAASPADAGQRAPALAAAEQQASRPGTGEPRVDAALRLLDRLPGLPVSDHPQLFEQVHAQLTDVLGELDAGTGGPADDRDQ